MGKTVSKSCPYCCSNEIDNAESAKSEGPLGGGLTLDQAVAESPCQDDSVTFPPAWQDDPGAWYGLRDLTKQEEEEEDGGNGGGRGAPPDPSAAGGGDSANPAPAAAAANSAWPPERTPESQSKAEEGALDREQNPAENWWARTSSGTSSNIAFHSANSSEKRSARSKGEVARGRLSSRDIGVRGDRERVSSRDGVRRPSGANACAIGMPFPKRPVMSKFSQKAWDRLRELFEKMDADGSNAVTRGKADEFFKGAFGNISTDAMFNEVDTDKSGAITPDEFVEFWTQVRSSGYDEASILEEVEEIMEGATWVDWKDNRDTGCYKEVPFPKRPLMCKLSGPVWRKCKQLFILLAGGDSVISHESALAVFTGNFGNVSVEGMFNEIDVHNHGSITSKEFMAFWVQVRGSGYTNKDILGEMDNLLEGGAWVDWKDGRNT